MTRCETASADRARKPTRPLLRWHGGKWRALERTEVLWINPKAADALDAERAPAQHAFAMEARP